MTTFTRRGALGLAGGAAVLPLLGAPALANTKTTVGALRFTSHAASFVAFERGYFTDEGLDVDFKFFEAAQPMAVAIASRDADFGVTSITGQTGVWSSIQLTGKDGGSVTVATSDVADFFSTSFSACQFIEQNWTVI